MISSLIDSIRIRIKIDHIKWLALQIQLFMTTTNPITSAAYFHRNRFKVPGAYGSSATVWSIKGATELVIECSVPRFLTGQNVFGTENLKSAVVKVARAVCKHLGIRPTPDEIDAIRRGDVGLNRIDLAAHLKFASDAQVEHYLKAIKLQLAFGHQSFSAYGNETLYANQHSDMKTLKLYSKGRQLNAYPLSASLPHRDFIYEAAEGLLRVELTLRLRYLMRNSLCLVKDWDADRGRALLLAEVEALELRNVRLTAYEQQPALTPHANALLAAHMAGADVETIVPSARALKTHARAIVEATGINVYVPFVAQANASKTDLESFADRLSFGTHPKAVALGITAALPANDPQLESRQPRSRAAGVTAVGRDSDTPANVGKPEKPAVTGVTAVTVAPAKVQMRRVRPLKPFVRSKRNQPSA
jgi:hypothetical protein